MLPILFPQRIVFACSEKSVRIDVTGILRPQIEQPLLLWKLQGRDGVQIGVVLLKIGFGVLQLSGRRRGC